MAARPMLKAAQPTASSTGVATSRSRASMGVAEQSRGEILRNRAPNRGQISRADQNCSNRLGEFPRVLAWLTPCQETNRH
jgi:hypothetical protein